MLSCGGNSHDFISPVKQDHVEPGIEELDSTLIFQTRDSLKRAGLVPIRTVNPRIIIELRYASKNNFMKMKLYDTLQELSLIHI